jgi:hypothetical protein
MPITRFLGLLLILSQQFCPAWAITWQFEEDGFAQGWRAQRGLSSGIASTNLELLRAEVRDGIWRIIPPSFEKSSRVTVSLISPFIAHDSALFDRLAIRLRLVHTRPIKSGITLNWTNPTNRAHPGRDDCEGRGSCYSRFEVYQPLIYSGEWQEVVITGLKEGTFFIDAQPVERVWAGELIDIRLELELSETNIRRPHIESEDEIPEAVEIDWITLTGVEERLQGELPPPLFTGSTPFGELFAFPVFYSLGMRGIGHTIPFTERRGALGDLDGDGDLDLVSLWVDAKGNDQGWLMAFNDGKGRFERPRPEPLASSPIPHLDGTDLDGDGRMDLMVSLESGGTRILHNDTAAGLIPTGEFPTQWAPGLADADGDGDADLWLVDRSQAEVYPLWLYFNDGSGRFTSSISVIPQTPTEQFLPRRLVMHLRQGQVTGMLAWSPPTFLDPPERYAVFYLNEAGEIVQEPLGLHLAPYLIRYVGDFDLDGDVDLVASDEMQFDTSVLFKGLQVILNRGDGSLETLRWNTSALLPHDVQFFDLNGDSFLDPVFVDSNPQHPAVVVSLGAEGGLPIQEGRYPLEGTGGMVLAGDVNGDGVMDLVALERSTAESGGVYVLLGRVFNTVTAVEEPVSVAPGQSSLSTAYPNPFNPGVVIPFTLGTPGGATSLEIYNTLGQVVGRMELGELPAGAHQVTWDGRDGQGKALSSGVYLYRLQAGTWSATGKLVKSE